MPYILAIDTSTDACSVALLTPEGVHQSLVIAAREHTQRLLPMIDALLKEHQVSISTLNAIAFCVGPGSFTGLRIALSTAQGLAYGADLPLIPISTLETLACSALRLQLATPDHIIIPSIDARMNEVYWSAYRTNESGNLSVLCDETLSSPEHLAESEWVKNVNQQAIAAVGSGWQYDCLIDATKDAVSAAAVTISAYPEAYDMALLAEKVYQQDVDESEKFISPLAAVPTYMRNEISWKKRTRIREKATTQQ
jgi:tRNA threonylcarbamoyladenosine biosynthesis protein TsaB